MCNYYWTTWEDHDRNIANYKLQQKKNQIIVRIAFLDSQKLEQLERLHSEIPPAAAWLPMLVIHIRSKVKTRQSQSYKFKKNRTVGATERTHYGTDAGRTRDGQTDRRSETNIPPQQLRCVGGIIIIRSVAINMTLITMQKSWKLRSVTHLWEKPHTMVS